MKKTVSVLCVCALPSGSWPWCMCGALQQKACLTEQEERQAGTQAQHLCMYVLGQPKPGSCSAVAGTVYFL